jgi:uncharacterized protein
VTWHLHPTELALLRALLTQHLPGCEVRVFGSRVVGWPGSRGVKPHSDVDLAVSGAPSDLALAELRADLEESDLPWRVDVCLLDSLPPPLRERVCARGAVLMPPPAP